MNAAVAPQRCEGEKGQWTNIDQTRAEVRFSCKRIAGGGCVGGVLDEDWGLVLGGMTYRG